MNSFTINFTHICYYFPIIAVSHVFTFTASAEFLLDSPWCEIRPTHDSFKHIRTTFPSRKKEKFEDKLHVKSRNEPSCIMYVVYSFYTSIISSTMSSNFFRHYYIVFLSNPFSKIISVRWYQLHRKHLPLMP